MKLSLRLVAILAIRSSANADDCKLNCWFASKTLESYNRCLSDCGGSSSNEVKHTKSSSLRGSSTLLKDLLDQTKKDSVNQDVDFIQEDSQCAVFYSPCSTSADCCGQVACVNIFRSRLCAAIEIIHDNPDDDPFSIDDDNLVVTPKFDDDHAENVIVSDIKLEDREGEEHRNQFEGKFVKEENSCIKFGHSCTTTSECCSFFSCTSATPGGKVCAF